MINWVKALFTSDKILEEDKGEYVPFTDIIGKETMVRLYGIFERYINQNVLSEPFTDVLKKELLHTNEWFNTKKILSNMKLEVSEKDLLSFLETNCYRVWFPLKKLEGRIFSQNEITALTGFSFFSECCEDDDYPHVSVHEEVNEQRKFSHPMFSDNVFELNMDCMMKDFNEFTKREGTVTL